MGKKLFKFVSDPASKVETPRERNGPTRAEETATPKVPRGEAAAPTASKAPATVDDKALTDAIQTQIERSEERAAKYVKPSVDIEDLAPPDEMGFLKILSEQTGLRIVNLNEFEKPSLELIRLLTPEQANHLGAVPVAATDDGKVLFAVLDPSNPMITDDLRSIVEHETEAEIEAVIAGEGEIRERLEKYYGMHGESLDEIVARVEVLEENKAVGGVQEVNLSDMDAINRSAPAIRLTKILLIKAIKERASDIHIEPFPNIIRIRYRVDGVLREIPSPPRNLLEGIVSGIKVMAQLDISESRLPQDGRVKLNLDGREIDLRVSTIPTVHGEAIVMRILDKQMMLVGIKQIGMTDELLQRYMHFIRKPNGIVLVTGPSGCGKTTTLYASISEINDPGEKFITTEDPVEYQLDGILQININANVGLTFARCLRSILRHDPDRVLVGEIRDVETAQIAVQAALTGHLVFSTLHTNSAAGTITRLIEMGLKPFLITSSLQAIVAQRLVRTICSQCRTPCRPDPLELEMFGVTPADVRDKTFYRGEGCGECGHTGYRGRMGLFEMLELDDEMSELILDQGSTDEIHALAVRNGMITMRQDGWLKICLGLTTFEEVMRETPREEEVEILTGAPEDEEKGAEEVEAKEKKPLEPKPKPQISDKTGVPEGEAAALPPPVQGDAEKR